MRLLAFLGLAIITAACSTNPDKNITLSEKAYYDAAQKSLSYGNFDTASKHLEELESHYPVGAYTEQINGLLDGGADLILIETVFDTLNAKAALFACLSVFEQRQKEWPIIVSGTITDQSGRTLSGQTAEAFLISVSHVNLFAVGFNCALGAKDLRPHLQVLAKHAPFYISAYPNAGLPNEFGQYDETPEQMGSQIREFLELGLINILGGCCGTTPDHIRKMAEIAKNYKPRPLPNIS